MKNNPKIICLDHKTPAFYSISYTILLIKTTIMNSIRLTVAFLLVLSLANISKSSRIISLSPEHRGPQNDNLFCESWKLSIETNNAGVWDVVPKKCVNFVEEYMTGERYRSDSEVVSEYALEYAKTVSIAGDGKDAWIFNIDETLISNLPYYANHGFGSEVFDVMAFFEWIDLAEAYALPASFRLYTELQLLGFKIILLTGRSESQRKCTEKNLEYAGFTNYEKLILSGDTYYGKSTTLYKSEKRQELKDEGYRIHGNSGHQWSDLWGFATAKRSFKLPNPMYYIP